MKKWTLLLTIMALVCWLPGQAQANYLDKYVSTLDVFVSGDAGFPTTGPYGTVTVYRYSTTSASAKFELNYTPTDFDFFDNNADYSAFLNVSGKFSVTDNSSDWVYTTTPQTPIAALGQFDVSAKTYSEQSSVSFDLNAIDGNSWASAQSVLEFNAQGFDAGAKIVKDLATGTDPKGYVGEVPLPGAVLLLGAGMARLVAYRRKRQA